MRKIAAMETMALLSDGYVLVSQSQGCETVTLRHRTNGNRIFIRCSQLGVHVYKNGDLVKSEIV